MGGWNSLKLADYMSHNFGVTLAYLEWFTMLATSSTYLQWLDY